ncbi:unnamed protein product, partial [marine sediment metagenome]
MEIITKRILIKNVAKKWKKQYYKDNEWLYDDNKRKIYNGLKELDL